MYNLKSWTGLKEDFWFFYKYLPQNSKDKENREDCDTYDYRLIIDICIAVGIVFLSLIVFYQYIFGGTIFVPSMNSDLIRANIPAYTMIYDNLHGNWSNWSWYMGIGTSIYTHADVLYDPFTYILFWGNREDIGNLMTVSFLIKLICEGIAFSYLIRIWRLHPCAIILSSIVYAFSGFSMIMGMNFALGTIMVYFPILLLFIERNLIKKSVRNNIGIVITLFLIGIYSYYYYYIAVILCLIYLFIRTYLLGRSWKCEIKNFILFAIGAFLLAGFAIIPQLYLTLGSTRLSAGQDVHFGLSLFKFDYKLLITFLIRLGGNNLLGGPLDYYGKNHDFFAAALCTSSLMVPLFVQYISKCEKRFWRTVFGGLLCIGVISIPFFSFLFNAFATINYRWLFCIQCLLAVILGISIDSAIKSGVQAALFKKTCIVIYTVIVFGGGLTILHAKKSIHGFFDFVITDVGIYYLFLLSSFILWYFLFKKIFVKQNRVIYKKIFIGVLSIFLCLEIVVNYFSLYQPLLSLYTMEDEQKGYFGASNNVIKRLHEEDKGSYRIYKSFDSVYDDKGIPSDNDALVQRYFGLKSYNSINNPSYINFLHKLGVYTACDLSLPKIREDGMQPDEVVGAELNYINGIEDKYELLGYLGVKYYICRDQDTVPDGYSFLREDDGLDIYVNTSNLHGLSYINNSYMHYDDFMQLSYEDRRKKLCTYTILPDDKELIQPDERNASYCDLVSFSNDDIKFDASISNKDDYICFSIPYDKGWTAFIDGEKTEISPINISLLGIKCPQGKHAVELKYNPPGLFLGRMLSLIALISLIGWYIILSVKHRRKGNIGGIL